MLLLVCMQVTAFLQVLPTRTLFYTHVSTSRHTPRSISLWAKGQGFGKKSAAVEEKSTTESGETNFPKDYEMQELGGGLTDRGAEGGMGLSMSTRPTMPKGEAKEGDVNAIFKKYGIVDKEKTPMGTSSSNTVLIHSFISHIYKIISTLFHPSPFSLLLSFSRSAILSLSPIPHFYFYFAPPRAFVSNTIILSILPFVPQLGIPSLLHFIL